MTLYLEKLEKKQIKAKTELEKAAFIKKFKSNKKWRKKKKKKAKEKKMKEKAKRKKEKKEAEKTASSQKFRENTGVRARIFQKRAYTTAIDALPE